MLRMMRYPLDFQLVHHMAHNLVMELGNPTDTYYLCSGLRQSTFYYYSNNGNYPYVVCATAAHGFQSAKL